MHLILKQSLNTLLFGIAVFCFASPAHAFDHSHALWEKVLKKYVSRVGSGAASETVIDYRLLKDNAGDLNTYLNELERTKPEDYEKFSEQEKLAFLINAYNAFAVKLILNAYPVKSIQSLGTAFKKPTTIRFFRLLGDERDLDEIQNKMIRFKFGDPRVLFALCPAAKGGPSLRGEAYRAATLNSQLDEATKSFVRDPKRNRLNTNAKELEISALFDWYGSDFENKTGGVRQFLAHWLTENKNEQALVLSADTRLRFLDYDWDLNGK